MARAAREGRDRVAARLRDARLYLAVEGGRGDIVRAALGAGLDMVQLRDKDADDATLRRAARELVEMCRAHGALFVVNDRPDLALESGADAVHLGQDDAPVEAVRAEVGDRLAIGLSTHSPEQIAAAEASSADYYAVGPVHATPTKPGRPAVGLELVRHAAAVASKPWFAIGGIDPGNVHEVAAAGARRVVIVRAIRDAADPAAATRALRERLEAGHRLPARPPSRSEAKDAAARAALPPLREGERPRAVTVAAVVAGALAVANMAAWLAGAKIGHERPAAPGVVSYSILMGIAAWGLWRSRYWAVLGMEALLGIVILIFSVLVLTASDLLTVAIALAVIVPCGALFWFLIRAMARIQMRDRRPG